MSSWASSAARLSLSRVPLMGSSSCSLLSGRDWRSLKSGLVKITDHWSHCNSLYYFRWRHSDLLLLWCWYRSSPGPGKLQQVQPQLSQGRHLRLLCQHLHQLLLFYRHLLYPGLHGRLQGCGGGGRGEEWSWPGIPRVSWGGVDHRSLASLGLPLLHHAAHPGNRLSVLWCGVSDDWSRGQLASHPPASPEEVHPRHDRVHVHPGFAHDHQERYLCVPADGLLRGQWHVSVVVCLLPDYCHLLGVWCQKILRMYRGDDWIQSELLLVHLLGSPGSCIHVGENH